PVHVLHSQPDQVHADVSFDPADFIRLWPSDFGPTLRHGNGWGPQLNDGAAQVVVEESGGLRAQMGGWAGGIVCPEPAWLYDLFFALARAYEISSRKRI